MQLRSEEVCRYFFRAGGAAGTIAKTIFAYDMTVSDVIYEREGYVSADRASKMMGREFDLSSIDSLKRGPSRFFAFADTGARS